ncbi:MAG: glycosyltransferase [Clostridiales bacterium]|nr:glycosyltransferase [Clostridiales bacterium]
MYNIDITFVILHYNVTNETYNCVSSIKENIDTKNYYIIIVDNNSPNKSGMIIAEKYRNDKKIHILINKENLGFAKGNNIGIDYARKLNSKYICCLNNDILLEQKNFYQTLNNEFIKSHVAAIGPKVILKDNSVQDFNMFFYNVNEYKRRLNDLEGKEYNHFERFINKLFSKTMIINKLKLLHTRHIEHYNKNKKRCNFTWMLYNIYTSFLF